MRLPALDRRGAVPRSALYLGALLVIALVALLLLRRNPPPPDLTLGGKLFSVSADRIDGLLLTRGGAQYRLDRNENGYWVLSGGVSDFLDQGSVARLLTSLTSATGGRLLPGSDPEDRRYEFNAPGALRLTVFADDGTAEKLAIGAQNPVTEAYYGSGAGRPACFPVAAGLRELLAGLPASLQLKTLLPGLARGSVTAIEVWRGEQLDLLENHDGRWWLRTPEAGALALGPWYRDYTARYSDRSKTHDGVTWVLADDQAARLIIYECSQVLVKEILPPGDAARRRDELGLDQPWRRVRLTGQSINPDPSAGSPDQLELAFGQAVNEKRVPAERRGNVLLTEPEAINTLGEPVAELLNTRALDFLVALADSMSLEREGKQQLRAHRDKTPALPGERFKERPVDFWLTDLPAAPTDIMDERARHGRSQNLLTNLDRTPILRLLPPTDESAVLQDRERVRVTLWFPEGPGGPGVAAGRVMIEIGFLDLDRLPAGSPDLAVSEDGLEPVGLWRPGTGQLLQIPGYTITTARAWAQD
jgi:hypothetical protein